MLDDQYHCGSGTSENNFMKSQDNIDFKRDIRYNLIKEVVMTTSRSANLFARS